MIALLASAIGFTFGLMMLPMLVPGVRVRGSTTAIKAGAVCGLLSAVLGKVLLVLLKLVFLLPVLLTGPIGPFVIQGMVNAILLHLTSQFVDGIEFDRTKTLLWAAFALTVLQTIIRMLAPGGDSLFALC